MSASPPLRVLYGGTFDPVHGGHLAIARCAAEVLRTRVDLMPAADPPHRGETGASAADRVAMLRLALHGQAGLGLDLRELGRPGPSWSIDTLRELRREIGDNIALALLVGADSFAGLPQWKSWRALFGLAHFVVASRGGDPGDASAGPELAAELADRIAVDAAELRASPGGRVLFLRQPLHAHSATEVRARIASGQPWRQLVPAAVAGYIEAHRLYGLRPGVIGR